MSPRRSCTPERLAHDRAAPPGRAATGGGAIQAGYTFDEPAIDLGVLMENDAPVTEARVRIPLSMLNRHGLVAGATGTGKTKTLQVLAEAISLAGVPVFAADIKGDLSGIAAPGDGRTRSCWPGRSKIGQDWQPQGCPVEFYSLGGRRRRRAAARDGHLVRARSCCPRCSV